MKTSLYLITFLSLIVDSLLKYHKADHSNDDFTNINVNRTINLVSNIVEVTTSIQIRNNQVDPADVYRVPYFKNNTSNLLFIEASMKSVDEEDETNIKIKVHKQHAAHENFTFYDLSFRSEPMNHEEERLIVIKEYYYNQYEMLPKSITLLEDQLSLYRGVYNFISFYETLEQTTRFVLPNLTGKSKVIGYTKDNAAIDENKIIYKLVEPVEPLKALDTKIHFEANVPYYELNYAEKTVDISHWGNIVVEEKFEVVHTGAKLIGEFGRVDFSSKGHKKGGRNSLFGLVAILPLKANNLWYRDEIGNVSTSYSEREWDNVKMDLEFRFPLLGGWKNSFNIGYNLPSKFFIEQNNLGDYKLKTNFGFPFNQVLAKTYTLRVILPENAYVSKINLPLHESYKVSYETTFSFLDFFGRTTVVITINNCFYIHDIPLEVSKISKLFNI